MDHAAREALIGTAFSERFGGRPTSWYRAPGRVDLMGSHTDYNEGHVLTMSVDRDTWLAVRPRTDGRVAITSLNLPGEAEFDLDAIAPDGEVPWTDYVRGAAAVLIESGHRLVGFDGLLHSTVPFGSGLSSWAAIEIATLLAFAGSADLRLEPLDRRSGDDGHAPGHGRSARTHRAAPGWRRLRRLPGGARGARCGS